MKIYIGGKILLGLVASIFILTSLGILSYWYFSGFTYSTQWTNHARGVLQRTVEVRTALLLIENGERGYVLTGEDEFLGSFEARIKNLHAWVDELDSLTRDNALQQDRINELRPQINAHLASIRSIVETRKENSDKAREMVLSEERTRIPGIVAALDAIQEEERGLILSRSLSFQEGFNRFVAAFIGLVVCTVVVLVWLMAVINSNMKSRTAAESRLIEAQAETRKINQDLEAFSYSVSHDLRAPLRSINGYAQILMEDYAPKFDSEGNRLLDIIVYNAKRMGNLIDDLLEFSKLGRQELKRSLVDVDLQVRYVTNELLEREGERKVELTIGSLKPVMMDANLMRQVWINLFSNALKYSQKKDRTVIEIGCIEGSKEPEVIYFVKDNGAGFDMEYEKKLFGVFQRLHKNTEFEGTGVGLALVKKIVERHKGRVWAEGKVGEGATFYIALPLS